MEDLCGGKEITTVAEHSSAWHEATVRARPVPSSKSAGRDHSSALFLFLETFA
jgi:hypothetical protein